MTEQQRKEQIAEWIAITEADRKEAEVSCQVDAKPTVGRPEGGTAKAAREPGIQEMVTTIGALVTEMPELRLA